MRKLLILFVIFIAPAHLHASLIDKASIAYGIEKDSEVNALRLSVQKEWDVLWLEEYFFNITGNWELAYAYLHDTDSSNGDENTSIFSFSPVFRVVPRDISDSSLKPFLELSIGPSIFTNKQVDDSSLSTNFQFEDRIGLGFAFGEQSQFEVKYNYIHYSNASIDSPNPGVDMHWFSFTYKW